MGRARKPLKKGPSRKTTVKNLKNMQANLELIKKLQEDLSKLNLGDHFKQSNHNQKRNYCQNWYGQ